MPRRLQFIGEMGSEDYEEAERRIGPERGFHEDEAEDGEEKEEVEEGNADENDSEEEEDADEEIGETTELPVNDEARERQEWEIRRDYLVFRVQMALYRKDIRFLAYHIRSQYFFMTGSRFPNIIFFTTFYAIAGLNDGPSLWNHQLQRMEDCLARLHTLNAEANQALLVFCSSYRAAIVGIAQSNVDVIHAAADDVLQNITDRFSLIDHSFGSPRESNLVRLQWVESTNYIPRGAPDLEAMRDRRAVMEEQATMREWEEWVEMMYGEDSEQDA